MLLPLVVAHSCFGSHTHWVTLVRSVPMYLSCVIARVPSVLPKNPVLHSRTKHIDVRYHFLRDNVEKGNICLIHVPTEKQFADTLTKPLDQTTFARLRGELGDVFLFELRLGWLMYICMLHFHLCIISCLHLCIIDCSCIICSRDVLLSYALITMICSMWGYDFASDAHEMYSCALVALGYISLWMPFFYKNTIWSSLVSWILSCSICALIAISRLICAWNHVLFIWGHRSIYHHECLAYMLPCGEA
jgi:hypothetical protein